MIFVLHVLVMMRWGYRMISRCFSRLGLGDGGNWTMHARKSMDDNCGVNDDAAVLLPLESFSDIMQAFLAQLQHWH